MSNQMVISQTAERLSQLTTGICYDATNYFIRKGYFLKINHIGLILQECYMASLCILSLQSGFYADREEIERIVKETHEPIRDWLVSIYSATNRDYDYGVLVTNVVENLFPYYSNWCQQLTGENNEIDCKDIGKWAPAATSACVRNIINELEQDLDITLSHEITDLNEIIFQHLYNSDEVK
ncbi:MAG: hypothetical protein KAR42_00635 [candidate division Zixibacteria bacterium]|nr:hypothetical protein [candidate division Zixibacteria bacterium]